MMQVAKSLKYGYRTERAAADTEYDERFGFFADAVAIGNHFVKIIVLDEGRIVGIGTHDELMKNCNEYREIAESQLSKAELEGGVA